MNHLKAKKGIILFIDSGIGGLSTLSETTKLTNSNFIYFADNKHSPYGSKSKEFLQYRLASIINKYAEKNSIQGVVLACNTATTSSIDFLRKQFPNILIIGTEPALKVSIDRGFKNPAIIATPQTIKCLSKKQNNHRKLIACKGLSSIIEDFFKSNSYLSKLKLIKYIYKIKHKIKKCDCVVLGCTHYILIKQTLSKILQIPLIDGNSGVARRIFDLISTKTTKVSNCKITLSKPNSATEQKYKKILKQILANQINLC